MLGARVTRSSELQGGLSSTVLAISDASGGHSVLRLMTNEPWRTHGGALTRRERAAQEELLATDVPAPVSLGLDAEGRATGVAAHLMSFVQGDPTGIVDESVVRSMAEMLAIIHAVKPTEPFRTYQSWAWDAKWVVPAWTEHPDSWRQAFNVLAGEPPGYEQTFLHRDYSHRNLLWTGGAISGVVDWVETSTGPAWLDAAHAATNLAVAFGPEPAEDFLAAYAALTDTEPDMYWLVMDAVGFLPPPGRDPLFNSAEELARLDAWLHRILAGGRSSLMF